MKSEPMKSAKKTCSTNEERCGLLANMRDSASPSRNYSHCFSFLLFLSQNLEHRVMRNNAVENARMNEFNLEQLRSTSVDIIEHKKIVALNASLVSELHHAEGHSKVMSAKLHKMSEKYQYEANIAMDYEFACKTSNRENTMHIAELAKLTEEMNSHKSLLCSKEESLQISKNALARCEQDLQSLKMMLSNAEDFKRNGLHKLEQEYADAMDSLRSTKQENAEYQAQLNSLKRSSQSQIEELLKKNRMAHTLYTECDVKIHEHLVKEEEMKARCCKEADMCLRQKERINQLNKELCEVSKGIDSEGLKNLKHLEKIATLERNADNFSLKMEKNKIKHANEIAALQESISTWKNEYSSLQESLAEKQRHMEAVALQVVEKADEEILKYRNTNKNLQERLEKILQSATFNHMQFDRPKVDIFDEARTSCVTSHLNSTKGLDISSLLSARNRDSNTQDQIALSFAHSQQKNIDGTMRKYRNTTQLSIIPYVTDVLGNPIEAVVLEEQLDHLQKSKYVDSSTDIAKLAYRYRQCFCEEDLALLYRDRTFSSLRELYASNPEHIRSVMEGLQSIMFEYRIRKTRLGNAWWRSRLKTLSFLNKNSIEIAEWARSEPWNSDSVEQLASMSVDTSILQSSYTLLNPMPNDK